MSDLEDYNELAKKLDGVTEEINQRQGALDHVQSELKEEFNVGTLKTAKALLKKMTKDRDKSEEEYNQKMSEFKERWKDVLEKTSG
jgi:hypothetical protein